jgi:hypothetical protein
MNIDVGRIVTEVLVVLLPTVLTAAVTYALAEWAKWKKNEKYGTALTVIERLADSLVRAAYQIGEANGWTKEQRHDFVLDQMKALSERMNLPFDREDLDRILDAILEASYLTAKSFELNDLPITEATDSEKDSAVFLPGPDITDSDPEVIVEDEEVLIKED